jgi:predicted RNA-binding Zn ribbon-like protein
MTVTLGPYRDRSQSGFDADQIEALAAFVELINSGRVPGGDRMASLAAVREFGGRYGFHGRPATGADVARLRAHRERLDAAAAACLAADYGAAIGRLNALLAETGAVPQVVAHDGRGPHIHVSRPAAPLADRIAAHLAMGLAGLLVSGEAGRLRCCASPGCRELFIDLSRNRSRRYCDGRTCGNRVHVAAYRARRSAGNSASRTA